MAKRSIHNRVDSEKRLSRRSWVGIVTVTVILIAVITTLSIQKKEQYMSDNAKQAEAKGQPATKGQKNYVTLTPEGQTVVVDRESGQTRGMTQDEKQRLAEGLKQLINNTDEGLVEVHHKDGTVSMDLQGHYHNVMLATKEDDGTVSQSCVDNLESAAAFFEIDPKLLGLVDSGPIRPRVTTKLEER